MLVRQVWGRLTANQVAQLPLTLGGTTDDLPLLSSHMR